MQTGDGGYVVAGVAANYNVISFPNPYRSDLWIIKLNSSGFVEWEGIYDWKVVDEASSFQQADDGYVVAGTSSTGGMFSSDVYKPWIVKIDNSGHIQWQKTYNESTFEKISSILKVNDGYVVAGSAAGDVWVFKIDGSGLIQWQKRYGGDESDWRQMLKKPTTATLLHQTRDPSQITLTSGFSNSTLLDLFPVFAFTKWLQMLKLVKRDLTNTFLPLPPSFSLPGSM